ncbi:hypothetical protein [Nostoc sp. CMAA1605]|uniref:hypothetical protein n=1 Tax=Nostoc sp. CMAA1605 TaxID=2055159 RepID=UPI001F1C9506|nr:hypothetical protein [Nostoc sp. CMAA1605]
MMLKKLAASVLTSVGLLSLNASPTLARPAQDFRYHRSFNTTNCNIAINGERYTCDYGVMGAFSNASANLKLCSTRYCFILILSRAQLANVADGQDFYVNQVAFQQGNSIIDEWDASIRCGFSRSDGIGCLGELENGTRIAIYVE